MLQIMHTHMREAPWSRAAELFGIPSILVGQLFEQLPEIAAPFAGESAD